MLDALSIGISVCRRDFGTAGTVMFLLEIGELLEDWTRKKSVADLAESLSLPVSYTHLLMAGRISALDEKLAALGQTQEDYLPSEIEKFKDATGYEEFLDCLLYTSYHRDHESG